MTHTQKMLREQIAMLRIFLEEQSETIIARRHPEEPLTDEQSDAFDASIALTDCIQKLIVIAMK